MIVVSFLPFSEPRRERCKFCNQRLPLSHLALFTENHQVAGELDLCQRCYMLLAEVTGGKDDGDSENMFEEE